MAVCLTADWGAALEMCFAGTPVPFVERPEV